jgi:glutathione S-transferase
MLKLSMLKPSPNSMTVRIFLRASGLPYEEADVWGHTRSPEYLAKCPAHMTPLLETADLPKQAM